MVELSKFGEEGFLLNLELQNVLFGNFRFIMFSSSIVFDAGRVGLQLIMKESLHIVDNDSVLLKSDSLRVRLFQVNFIEEQSVEVEHESSGEGAAQRQALITK